MTTDSKRLQQVLKNLLSNAFKFTDQGGVCLRVYRATEGWSVEHPILNDTQAVIAFEVTDTGIGIPPEKQQIIFEAFQQADAEHQPEIRRHRSRAGDQPRTVEPAWRRDPAAQQPRTRQHLYAVPADQAPRRAEPGVAAIGCAAAIRPNPGYGADAARGAGSLDTG